MGGLVVGEGPPTGEETPIGDAWAGGRCTASRLGWLRNPGSRDGSRNGGRVGSGGLGITGVDGDCVWEGGRDRVEPLDS